MLPIEIFTDNQSPVPAIELTDIKHEGLGECVIRVTCLANGARAKRLTQHIYGRAVNEIPVWCISDMIVSDWFALLLEDAYQKEVAGKTVLVSRV